MSEVTDNFYEAFTAGTTGCERTCSCGIRHFDFVNQWDWDAGELESLLELEKTDDKLVSHDHSIGHYIIDGQEFVWGCTCEKGKKYQYFIDRHINQLADYIRKQHRDKKAETEKLELPDK